MPVEVRAPGKLILIGEYAVLEGAPAVVAAVDRTAFISINRRDTGSYSLSAPEIGIDRLEFTPDRQGIPEFAHPPDLAKLKFFQAAFTRTWQNQKDKDTAPLDIRIDTSAFFFASDLKLGLGSSAAVTCGLTQGLSTVRGMELSRDRLFSEALAIHHTAQGELGSGIDIAASVFGGVLLFHKKTPVPDVRNIGLFEDIIILPVWSGAQASTRELVKIVMQFKQNRPGQYNRLITAMAETSSAASEAWIGGDPDKFLAQIDRYGQLMRELGEKSHAPIISESHRRIAGIISKNNGVYKPSGAGAGDLGLAFWKRSAFPGGMDAELKAEGILPVELRFDNRGTIIHQS